MFTCMHATAQVQQGYVKTIGRPDKPGVALGNVTIRFQGLVNAVLSAEDGTFSLSSPYKKEGDALVLLSIRKNGYELSDKGLIGRPLVFSSQVPIIISMVDIRQLEADRQRIEKKAYETAEQNYREKLNTIEEQIKKNEITAEKYRSELQALQQGYENYLSLIGDLADRYARTDYDRLDSIDREIYFCIENGELERADSLIHTVFDPETVLERNRAAKEEIRQRIAFAQRVIDKANADKEAIRKDLQYAERVMTLGNTLVGQYLAQGETDKAMECLRALQEISTVLHGKDSRTTQEITSRIDSLQQLPPP